MQIKRTSESWWNQSKILVSVPSSWGWECWRPVPRWVGWAWGQLGLQALTPLVLGGGGSLFIPSCVSSPPLERKTVPLLTHPPVPSLSTSTTETKPPPQPSPPTSPVRTPLEVRLFPQLQTYMPYRPHPPQLRKVTSPLQSPTKTKPKVVSIDDLELSRHPSPPDDYPSVPRSASLGREASGET